MVSNIAFKIIKNAVGIRLARNEDSLKNLVKIYDKLSDKQVQDIIDYYSKKDDK